jgi:uncharacterized membrane protein
MNQHTRELATLREFQRIYTETEMTITKYKRYRLIIGMIGLGLILLSLFGGSTGFLAVREAVIAAMFGGVAAGFSFLYRLSLRQIPFLVRFTALDVPAIQKRIQEIEEFHRE